MAEVHSHSCKTYKKNFPISIQARKANERAKFLLSLKPGGEQEQSQERPPPVVGITIYCSFSLLPIVFPIYCKKQKSCSAKRGLNYCFIPFFTKKHHQKKLRFPKNLSHIHLLGLWNLHTLSARKRKSFHSTGDLNISVLTCSPVLADLG